MCINCNIVAPLSHKICDLLGVPRNRYGVVSNTFGTLVHLIIDINSNIKDGMYVKSSPFLDIRGKELLKYMEDNDLLHYLLELCTEGVNHPTVVNRQVINYKYYTHFTSNWTHDPDIVHQFKVPLQLLTDEPERLTKCIGRVDFQQTTIIPEETVQENRFTREAADRYSISLLPEQTFYESVKAEV
jgi:hypothetical protein